jgi:hypothetical protein
MALFDLGDVGKVMDVIECQKVDKAELKRLIAIYKIAKPERASHILIDIHKIIDKYM